MEGRKQLANQLLVHTAACVNLLVEPQKRCALAIRFTRNCSR